LSPNSREKKGTKKKGGRGEGQRAAVCPSITGDRGGKKEKKRGKGRNRRGERFKFNRDFAYYRLIYRRRRKRKGKRKKEMRVFNLDATRSPRWPAPFFLSILHTRGKGEKGETKRGGGEEGEGIHVNQNGPL